MAKAPSKGKGPAAKAPPKKAAKTGKKAKPGDQYSCEVCGLVVSVDEACGCVEPYDLVCCGEQMKAGK